MILKRFEFLIYAVPMFLFAAYWMFQIPTMIDEVAYDCRISEISPDVPQKVKKACRELQSIKLGDHHG
jgi:hypothetical protein